jgi:hypothetical protein
VAGCGKNERNSPSSAELLANGHILMADESNNRLMADESNNRLMADESNNRVIEVTRNRTIVWSYGSCTSSELSAAFASRLPNGQTLITDSNNHRILGVSAAKKIEFEYDTTSQLGSCDAARHLPACEPGSRVGKREHPDQQPV